MTSCIKTCSKCKCSLRLHDFGCNRSKKDGLQNWCKKCHKTYQDAYYRKDSVAHVRRTMRTSKARRSRNRKLLNEYLSTKCCVVCGESDPIVLDFDHVTAKKTNVSKMISGAYAWPTVLNEIEKCQILCANCHRRKTAKQFQWNK